MLNTFWWIWRWMFPPTVNDDLRTMADQYHEERAEHRRQKYEAEADRIIEQATRAARTGFHHIIYHIDHTLYSPEIARDYLRKRKVKAKVVTIDGYPRIEVKW